MAHATQDTIEIRAHELLRPGCNPRIVGHGQITHLDAHGREINIETEDGWTADLHRLDLLEVQS